MQKKTQTARPHKAAPVKAKRTTVAELETRLGGLELQFSSEQAANFSHRSRVSDAYGRIMRLIDKSDRKMFVLFVIFGSVASGALVLVLNLIAKVGV